MKFQCVQYCTCTDFMNSWAQAACAAVLPTFSLGLPNLKHWKFIQDLRFKMLVKALPLTEYPVIRYIIFRVHESVAGYCAVCNTCRYIGGSNGTVAPFRWLVSSQILVRLAGHIGRRIGNEKSDLKPLHILVVVK